MCSRVHRQAASTTAKSVTLGTVLASVTVFAEQFLLVLGAVCRVQGLIAHTLNGDGIGNVSDSSRLIDGWAILTALEASLMEFVATSNALFSGVDRFAACGALGSLCGNERHFDISVKLSKSEFIKIYYDLIYLFGIWLMKFIN